MGYEEERARNIANNNATIRGLGLDKRIFESPPSTPTPNTHRTQDGKGAIPGSSPFHEATSKKRKVSTDESLVSRVEVAGRRTDRKIAPTATSAPSSTTPASGGRPKRAASMQQLHVAFESSPEPPMIQQAPQDEGSEYQPSPGASAGHRSPTPSDDASDEEARVGSKTKGTSRSTAGSSARGRQSAGNGDTGGDGDAATVGAANTSTSKTTDVARPTMASKQRQKQKNMPAEDAPGNPANVPKRAGAVRDRPPNPRGRSKKTAADADIPTNVAPVITGPQDYVWTSEEFIAKMTDFLKLTDDNDAKGLEAVKKTLEKELEVCKEGTRRAEAERAAAEARKEAALAEFKLEKQRQATLAARLLAADGDDG